MRDQPLGKVKDKHPRQERMESLPGVNGQSRKSSPGIRAKLHGETKVFTNFLRVPSGVNPSKPLPDDRACRPNSSAPPRLRSTKLCGPGLSIGRRNLLLTKAKKKKQTP